MTRNYDPQTLIDAIAYEWFIAAEGDFVAHPVPARYVGPPTAGTIDLTDSHKTRRLAAVASMLPSSLPAVLHGSTEAVAADVAEHLARQLPQYQQEPAHLRIPVIKRALDGFINRLENPPATEDLGWLHRFGESQALKGHRLETVQNAFLVGAWAGWRRIAQECRRLSVSSAVLCELGDAAYRYADELFAVTAQGYRAAGDVSYQLRDFRKTLMDQLLADPPADPQVIAGLAVAAQWPLPEQVSVVVFDGGTAQPRWRATDRAVLAELTGVPPRLVSAAPATDLAGLLENLGDWRIAVGPLVALSAARQSFTCAVQALGMARRGVLGVLGTEPVIWCDRHPLLRRTTVDRTPTPLAALSERQRARLCEAVVPWVAETALRTDSGSDHIGGPTATAAQPAALNPNHPLYSLRIVEKREQGPR